MEALRLQLLGGLSITLGDSQLSLELSRKAQALFCYLAVSERPFSRDALAGLLWTDFPESRARANLRDTLSDLGRVLGHYLAIDQRTIAFVDEPALSLLTGHHQSWIDTAVFQGHISQVQRSFRNTPSPAMSRYRSSSPPSRRPSSTVEAALLTPMAAANRPEARM